MEKTNKAILKLMLAVVIALVTTGCGSSTPRKNHVNLGTFECGGFEVTVKGDVTTVDGWGSIPIRIKRLTDENESFHWVSNHRTRILIANYDVNEERGMTTTWVGLNHTVPPFDDCIVANRQSSCTNCGCSCVIIIAG